MNLAEFDCIQARTMNEPSGERQKGWMKVDFTVSLVICWVNQMPSSGSQLHWCASMSKSSKASNIFEKLISSDFIDFRSGKLEWIVKNEPR